MYLLRGKRRVGDHHQMVVDPRAIEVETIRFAVSRQRRGQSDAQRR